MKFLDFINTGQVRKSTPDRGLIKSLCKNSLNDLKYLKSQEVTILSSRKLVSNYYDCLRAVLEAIASLRGYKIYQHEAFTYFLEEIGEKVISIKFDRFRKIRNSINYYGENISIQESEDIIKEISKIIDFLIEKYLKKFRL